MILSNGFNRLILTYASLTMTERRITTHTRRLMAMTGQITMLIRKILTVITTTNIMGKQITGSIQRPETSGTFSLP